MTLQIAGICKCLPSLEISNDNPRTPTFWMLKLAHLSSLSQLRFTSLLIACHLPTTTNSPKTTSSVSPLDKTPSLSIMKSKEPAEQPTFGIASCPSSSYYYPELNSTNFLSWSSQPSPYRALTPWISYGSPSYMYSTSRTLAPATFHPSNQSLCRDSPYSYTASNTDAPTLIGSSNSSLGPSPGPNYDTTSGVEMHVKVEDHKQEINGPQNTQLCAASMEVGVFRDQVWQDLSDLPCLILNSKG